MNRQKLDLKEIQAIELGLLKHFHDLCEAYGLRYSLGGGTLLGSIRHQGFIPWDDDIDVMLPRPDYERFLQLCKDKELPFDVQARQLDDSCLSLSCKLVDRDTVLVEEFSGKPKDGIFLDVFPIDGLGESEESAKKVFMNSTFERELLNARMWDRYVPSKTHSIIMEPVRLGLFLLSRFYNGKKLSEKADRKGQKYDFESSAYAGCVCGSYRLKEIMEQKVFTEYIKVPFNGQEFYAIADYDSYLTKHYGDYMKLPPKEKQESHHMMEVYRK